jgi:hypothetical protein
MNTWVFWGILLWYVVCFHGLLNPESTRSELWKQTSRWLQSRVCRWSPLHVPGNSHIRCGLRVWSIWRLFSHWPDNCREESAVCLWRSTTWDSVANNLVSDAWSSLQEISPIFRVESWWRYGDVQNLLISSLKAHWWGGETEYDHTMFRDNDYLSNVFWTMCCLSLLHTIFWFCTAGGQDFQVSK